MAEQFREVKKKKKTRQCNMMKEPFFLPERSACKVKKKKKVFFVDWLRIACMYIIRSYFVIAFLFL